MDKQKLIDLTNELLKEEDLSKRSEDLLFLKRSYKFLAKREEETFYEKQLTEKFNSLYEELAKKEPKLNQSSYDEKKEIIALARELLKRNDFNKAIKELDGYSESFRKAGRCSNEQEEELNAEFKAVKDEFFANKRAYYAEINKNNAEKKAKKEDIISRAKELLDNIKNIKETNEKMDALMEEWKAVGYAGKEDEELWHSFSAVRKEFNNKKKEHRLEMQKLFDERAQKKEELIKEAKSILADSDFSDEEVNKIRKLKDEFIKIGFAGKEKNDDLYERFNEVIKKYFEEKKFYTL